jgi:hypothetical protein
MKALRHPLAQAEGFRILRAAPSSHRKVFFAKETLPNSAIEQSRVDNWVDRNRQHKIISL